MLRHRRGFVVAILVACLSIVGQRAAQATQYYFSDCGCNAAAACQGAFCNVNPAAAGCSPIPPAAGSVGNPWCLDPGSTGLKNSFDYVMDGTAPDVSAGDTINLCAGACDGTGSATWYLEPHFNSATGAYTVFDPAVGSTSSVIINIKPYPGETVTLSGDANNDNIYTAGTDAQRFWDSRKSGSSTTAYMGYQLSGFTIEKFAERTINISEASGGPFVLDNMTVQRGGAGSVGNGYFAALTGDGGMAAMGCTNTNAQRDLINNALDSYATFIFGHNRNGASLTVQNSTIRQNCQYVARSNGNCYGPGGTVTNADIEACNPATSAGNITFNNNTIYSVFGLHNGHQGRGWTWTHNTIYDFFGGIGTEENVQDTTITDNNFSCRGTYKTDAPGRCRTAIVINDGDTGELNCNDDGSGGLPHCSTNKVLIARNKIWGANYYTTPGFLLGGISYSAHNSSSQNGGLASAIIENNFIWFTQRSSGCNPFSNVDFTEAPLNIATNDSITVRNNTIYNNGCPVTLRTGVSATEGGTGPVAHNFTNNIVGFAHYYPGGSDVVELFVAASAVGSTIANNDFHYGSDSATSNPICTSGTAGVSASGGCTSGTYTSCSGVSSYRTNNICQPTTYRSVSGAKSLWDLHLAPGDTVNKDKGVPGPLEDIDKQARIGTCDIGADEVDSQDTTAPAAPQGIQVSQ